MQTLLVIALLLGGAACEVYGLVTIARDVKNAAAATQAIANEANTVMAANRAVVVDWITRATVGTIGDLDRRKKGVVAFAVGLAMQTAANLIALA